jgi:endonuclease YncB( thermonuclease family)
MDITRIETLRKSDARCARLSLRGQTRVAKVVSVYDGDTFRANLYLRETDNEPTQLVVRVVGYDAPEIHSRCPVERRLAKDARQMLIDIVQDRMVRLEIQGEDKYGRTLARVFTRLSSDGRELDVASWFLANCTVRPYDGAAREAWVLDPDSVFTTKLTPNTQDII